MVTQSAPLNQFTAENFIDYEAALQVLVERRVMKEKDLQYAIAGKEKTQTERHANNRVRKNIEMWEQRGWGKWRS